MIDRNKYESLADALASTDDLNKVRRALMREEVIREVMAETGESRDIVTGVADAADSMSQEAVTDLTDGEPTTLENALSRLAEEWHRDGVPDGAEYELDTLLNYPWPGVLVPEDQTRVVLTVQWNPREGHPYYDPSERADILREWVEQGLDSRDDCPGVIEFKAS